ncbi:hypothetical protein B0H11DRAFT_2189416 [Mycena galericulata]|nr:hypothetical protein B0H11DRAFT_2189416 [Mycena galericulata]
MQAQFCVKKNQVGEVPSGKREGFSQSALVVGVKPRGAMKTPAREVSAVIDSPLRAPRAARLCDDSAAELVFPRTTAPPGPNHRDNGSRQSTTRPCRRRSSGELYSGAKKLKLIPIDGIGRAISSEGNFTGLQVIETAKSIVCRVNYSLVPQLVSRATSAHRVPSPGPTLLTSRPPSSIVRLPVLQIRLRLAYGNDIKRYGWGGEWNEVPTREHRRGEGTARARSGGNARYLSIPANTSRAGVFTGTHGLIPNPTGSRSSAFPRSSKNAAAIEARVIAASYYSASHHMIVFNATHRLFYLIDFTPHPLTNRSRDTPVRMTISLPLGHASNVVRTSSPSTKRPGHSRLSSPKKSPPTCTLSLTSAHADKWKSNVPPLFELHAAYVQFPSSTCQLDEGENYHRSLFPACAPISHIVPPKPKRPRLNDDSPHRVPNPRGHISSSDTRFAAVIERSISQRLAVHSQSLPEPSDLDVQDALLAARLRASRLARKRSPSPPRVLPISPHALSIPPAPTVALSLLFSGSSAFDTRFSTPPTVTTPMQKPVRANVSVLPRLRSTSRADSYSNAPPSMPALVARLMLRRRAGAPSSPNAARAGHAREILPQTHPNAAEMALRNARFTPRISSPLARP